MGVNLAPGDVVYIPNLWFHEVHTTELADDGLNMSMNFWFPDGPKNDLNIKRFRAKDYITIMRNIEKMVGQVVPNPETDAAQLLKLIVNGRYDDCEVFDLENRDKQAL